MPRGIERSIKNRRLFLMGINVLSLFDGISCGQVALKRAGIEVDNYYASEIDEYAIKITQKNFPNTIQLGSVIDIKSESLPKIDLLIGGSPCQSFSRIGNGLGFDGKSKLFFEYVRVLREVKPQWFILENVEMKKEWENVITNTLGVKPIKINSSLFSAQNRPRVFWTNIEIKELPKECTLNIKNILLNLQDFKKEYPNYLNLNFCKKKRLDRVKNFNQKASCLTASMYKGQVSSFCKDDLNRVHKYSPIECERLQTLPDNYTKGISDTRRFQCLGNGWTVDVIAHILTKLNDGNDGIPPKPKDLGILPTII
jgi:site-specific DNA-cytosine methylase